MFVELSLLVILISDVGNIVLVNAFSELRANTSLLQQKSSKVISVQLSMKQRYAQANEGIGI